MILLCSRWRKVVILNVLRQVSMLCYLCLFFKLCSWGFYSPVATPAHGLLGLCPSFQLQFMSENACFLALYVCSTTHGPTSKVVNSASFLCALSLFIYFCSMSGLLRSCCRWPELNHIIHSRRSHDFVRSRFTQAHSLESELSYAAKYFLKHISFWS